MLGHAEIAALLISKGADINAADDLHRTPLHTACKNGKQDVVKLLLERGAAVNVVDWQGQAPLDMAKE